MRQCTVCAPPPGKDGGGPRRPLTGLLRQAKTQPARSLPLPLAPSGGSETPDWPSRVGRARLSPLGRTACTGFFFPSTPPHARVGMVSMDTREGGGRGGHSGYSGNSSGRGRGGRGFSNSNGWQNTNSYPQNTSYAPRGRGRFGGRGGRGGGRGYGANAAPDVEFVSDLRGHRRKVTCLYIIIE